MTRAADSFTSFHVYILISWFWKGLLLSPHLSVPRKHVLQLPCQHSTSLTKPDLLPSWVRSIKRSELNHANPKGIMCTDSGICEHWAFSSHNSVFMLDFIHPNYPPENWHIIYPENWCLDFFKMKFPFKILFRGHVKFRGGRAYERVKQSNSGILTLFICSMTSTHAVCSDMGSQSYLFKVRSVHLCGSDMFTLVPRNIYTSETQKDFLSVLLHICLLL